MLQVNSRKLRRPFFRLQEFEPSELLLGRIAQTSGSLDIARDAFVDVKLLLLVARFCGGQAVYVPPRIDPSLHEALSVTPEYLALCNIVGGFVHHCPNDVGHALEPEDVECTAQRAVELFGQIPSQRWHAVAAPACYLRWERPATS